MLPILFSIVPGRNTRAVAEGVCEVERITITAERSDLLDGKRTLKKESFRLLHSQIPAVVLRRAVQVKTEQAVQRGFADMEFSGQFLESHIRPDSGVHQRDGLREFFRIRRLNLRRQFQQKLKGKRTEFRMRVPVFPEKKFFNPVKQSVESLEIPDGKHDLSGQSGLADNGGKGGPGEPQRKFAAESGFSSVSSEEISEGIFVPVSKGISSARMKE